MRKVSKTNTLAKRRHIMRAALTCFQRSGFHQASMADICAEAKMSRGHVYHYFDSKEALIEAVVDENWRAVQEALKEDAVKGSHGMRENIFSFMVPDGEDTDAAVLTMDNALALEIVVEASRNKRLRALLHKAMNKSNKVIRDLVDGAARGGQVGAALDPAAVTVLFKLISAGWNVLSLSDPEFDKDRFATLLEALLRPLLNGAATPTGVPVSAVQRPVRSRPRG